MGRPFVTGSLRASRARAQHSRGSRVGARAAVPSAGGRGRSSEFQLPLGVARQVPGVAWGRRCPLPWQRELSLPCVWAPRGTWAQRGRGRETEQEEKEQAWAARCRAQGHKQSPPSPAEAEGQGRCGVTGPGGPAPRPPNTTRSTNRCPLSPDPCGDRWSTPPEASRTSTRRSASSARTSSGPSAIGRWGSSGSSRAGAASPPAWPRTESGLCTASLSRAAGAQGPCAACRPAPLCPVA